MATTMSGVKYDVMWSPVHENKFVTWSTGTDISLYQVHSVDDVELPQMPLICMSPTSAAVLQASVSENGYVRAVDIHPTYEQDILLAVGQANGRVTVKTVGGNTSVFREFAPRHARQCNAVAWNPQDTDLLVVALDKYRSECGAMVWDASVSTYMPSSSSSSFEMLSHKPVAEMLISESVHSAAWMLHCPKTLMLGASNKHLKLFDLRDGTKVQSSTSTKAVWGLSVDPLATHRLASFVDSTVAMWDLRNLEKPVFLLTQPKQLMKIAWCPTRRGLLASLCLDAFSIGLHDVQQSSLGTDEVDPAVLERSLPFGKSVLSSFAWHPLKENHLLAVTVGGGLIEHCVWERRTLSWSPSMSLSWSNSKNILLSLDGEQGQHLLNQEDVAVTMKLRAMNGYGTESKLSRNGDLVDDPPLKRAWYWLEHCRRETEFKDKHKEMCFKGISSVLRVESGGSIQSEAVKMNWAGLDQRRPPVAQMYRSKERQKAIQLCGWNFDADPSIDANSRHSNLGHFLTSLEDNGEYTRAAAIAAFHLQIRRALQCLQRGSVDGDDDNYGQLPIISMALAGFCDERSSLWHEMCQRSATHLKDPYLRVLFAFLTSEQDTYDRVLEEAITVADRVAFACLYLSDSHLMEFIEKMTIHLKTLGNLDGLLLTGLTTEGVELLQNYLNITGDVQTVSLIGAVSVVHGKLEKEPRLTLWIDCYRELLDSWQLWHERARLDVFLQSDIPSHSLLKPTSIPPQQVIISCNFCSRSITPYLQGTSRRQGGSGAAANSASSNANPPYGRMSVGMNTQKFRLSACPICTKPLPRCAVCLVHMGTAAGTRNGQGIDKVPLSPFGTWFSWCQTCRHGGHATHMADWFNDNTDCPVTGCSCRCKAVDSVSLQGSKNCSAMLKC